jgi:hypothetical protein
MIYKKYVFEDEDEIEDPKEVPNGNKILNA